MASFDMTARQWYRAHPGEFRTVHGFDRFIRRYHARLTEAGILKPGGKQTGRPSHVKSVLLSQFLATIKAKRGALPEHGTAARYKRGCRCDPCKAAHTLYNKDYYQKNGRKYSEADRLAQRRYNAKLRAEKRGIDRKKIVAVRVHRMKG